MTTTTKDILSAITEAAAALDRQPELEATIRQLRDDLELARMEIEDKAKAIEVREARIDELETKVDRLHYENDDLKGLLDSANTTITSLRHEKTGLELDLAQSRIDNETKSIAISALERDKASLEATLSEERGLSASLRSTLDAIKSILPAPEVAKAATFPSEPVAADNDGDRPGPVVDTALQMDAEVVKPIEAKSEPVYGEYNAFNNFG